VIYEIESDHAQRFSVTPVSTGNGFGKVRIIDAPTLCSLESEQEPVLLVADNLSMKLRPTLQHAIGYIFRTGQRLSHFANIIRYHNIPACISEELWQRAVEMDQQRCHFRSIHEPPDDAKLAEFKVDHSKFCLQTQSHDLHIPVIDMAGGLQCKQINEDDEHERDWIASCARNDGGEGLDCGACCEESADDVAMRSQ